MLYLFKNVYLVLDNSIEPSTPCVLITPKARLIPTGEFDYRVTETDLGHILHASETVDGVLGTAGGVTTFFDALNANQYDSRVLIYASPVNFVEFAARWYKTILPNLTANSAHTLLMLTLTWLSSTLGYPYAPHKRLNASAAADYRTLPAHLPADAAGDWWDSISAFDLSAEAKNTVVTQCGVEFQLATYLVNSNWEHAPVLLAKLTDMVATTRLAIVTDTLRDIATRPIVLPGFDISSDTIESWVSRTNHLPILLDKQLFREDLEYLRNTYTDDEIRAVLVEVTNLLGYDINDVALNSVLFADVSSIDAILDRDRTFGAYSAIIATSTRQQTVNTYVLNRLMVERDNADRPFANTISLTNENHPDI